MAEKKYIGVNPEDGTTLDLVRMLNPANEFRGMLMSVNPTDINEVLDVRDLFLAHVMVDGKTIQAYTDNSRRIVDISPHVELNIVSNDGNEPVFSQWACVPTRTASGTASQDNPYPDKRITLKQQSNGKWVVSVVVQEADPDSGVPEQTVDISSEKGDADSMVLHWKSDEIYYGRLGFFVVATRQCTNILGYRLGVENGLNEDKIILPTSGGSAELNPRWRCNPSTFGDEQISIQERVVEGSTSYVPVANGQEIGQPKTIPEGDSKIVWEASTEWNGETPLTARLSYAIDRQEQKKLQPSGNYLVAEDFEEVEVDELIANKITVKDGGSIEFNIGSTLQIVKGAGEAGIVIVDGNTTNELSFPNKTGNIAVDTDFAGYVSKSAIADVVDAVNSVVGTVEDKFNALMTQLEALANS